LKNVYYYLQYNYNKIAMEILVDSKNEKHRFVLLVEPDIFDDFKKLAQEQNRTAGNLGTMLIKEYVKNNKITK